MGAAYRASTEVCNDPGDQAHQISAVRARVNQKETVLFDYYIPIEGGITGEAIVAATRFFLRATAHAATECDEADIVR